MEDRALDLLELRLPATDHPLRTQGPLLRRVPLARRHPHLLQATRETHHVRHGLILQRHLQELVSAAFVVADASLVLSSAAPVRPGPDVLGWVHAGEQADQEPAYLR